MADIQKVISIDGDPSGLAAALAEAERQVKEASDRFDFIDKQLADRQAERAKLTEQQASKGRDQIVARAIETRIKSLDKETAALSAALAKQNAMIEKAQARVTAVHAKGSQDRIKLVKQEADAQDRSNASLLRGLARGAARTAAQGTGIGLPFLGGGLGGFAGGIAGAAVVAAVKATISSYIDLANAVQQFGVTAQASATQASTLIGVGRQLGIDTATLDAAFNSLKSAVANNPEQFDALGIALKNTDGSARPLIDVFEEVRSKIAGATKDSGTLQLAQELLGGSYKDLLPLLGLTDQQLADLEARVVESGGVIDEHGIQKANEWQVEVRELEGMWVSFTNTFGQAVVPTLINAAQGLGQAFDTLGTIIHDSLANAAAFLSGSGGTNPLDVIGNAMDSAQGRHDEQVARISATASAIVNASRSGSGPSLGGATRNALAAQQRADQQALRDRIQAIQDEARAREDQMREALDAFTKERDAAIRTIEDEQKASEKAHNAEIDRIQNEQDAYQEAFRVRDQARSDEIDRLREQIRATTELSDAEKNRQDLADAEAQLSIEQNVEVFRSKSETENDYAQAVRNQQNRVKDAEKKVGDARKKIAQDTAKAEIEARIRAIEAEREADRRLLDDKKRAADAQLAAIRKQMADEKEQSDKRIQQLRDQQAAERDRVGEAIKGIQKQTDAIVKGLQAQLKAAQDLGAALDYATRPRSIVITTTNVGGGATIGNGGAGQGGGGAPDTGPGNDAGLATRQDIIDAYQTLLGRPPENEGAITGRIGRSRASVWSEIFNSPEATAYRNRNKATPGGGGGSGDVGGSGGSGLFKNYDTPGSVRFTEPARIIGRSGRDYGTIAERGPEKVQFGGVPDRGDSADSGGGDVVVPVTLMLDSQVLARVQARQKARLASRSSGRRR